MDFLSPLARQLIVSSSPILAALSVGGLTAYPAVLINQLKGNDSSIELDPETSSWIASIHGFAGIPSILIPTIMQWKGRRFAFIAACLSTFIGWILTYYAIDAVTILIGESLHGFGGNSLVAVSLVTISEMVDPSFRSTLMLMFGITQTLGIVLVTLAGYFCHWRTVSLIMGVPTLISLLLVIVWPESPSWLACKGKFQKCEESFVMLRGTGATAMKELTQLLAAQKKSRQQMSLQGSLKSTIYRDTCVTLKRNDFLTPIIYLILIMFTFYFSGPLVIFTYAVDIIANTTNSSDFICFVYIDIVTVIGLILGIILIKRFNHKPILLVSFFGSGTFLVLGSIVIYCKEYDSIPKQALLVCVLGNIFCCTYGSSYLTFNMCTELIPVKHRGLGGALYIIVSCIFHSGSLKISPYLFESINVSGTFLVFAAVAIIGALLIWKFVPETKNKTLQDIEDFYNYDEDDRSTNVKFEMVVIDDDYDE